MSLTPFRRPWADLLTVDDWKREAAKLSATQPPVILRSPRGAIMTFPSTTARDTYLRRQIGRGVMFRTFPLSPPGA